MSDYEPIEYKVNMRMGTVITGDIVEDGNISIDTDDCDKDHHEAEAWCDAVEERAGGERTIKSKDSHQHTHHDHGHEHKASQ